MSLIQFCGRVDYAAGVSLRRSNSAGLDGRSFVDESLITGEPIPMEKTPGDSLTGATINGTGSLIMKATRVGAGTVLSQIVEMVEHAQRSRAPIQRYADRVAGLFVPVVILVAACAFIVWAIWGPTPSLSYALLSAVAVLIIACPCALGLATPMSIMTATGRGAQMAVLIKNAESLERFEAVDMLIVDKTGTLTKGEPQLVVVLSAAGHDEVTVLKLAATLEKGSEHPLAEAIVRGAEDRGVTMAEAADFEAVTGQGVRGTVDGKAVAIGDLKLFGVSREPRQLLLDRSNAPDHLIGVLDGVGFDEVLESVTTQVREVADAIAAGGDEG